MVAVPDFLDEWVLAAIQVGMRADPDCTEEKERQLLRILASQPSPVRAELQFNSLKAGFAASLLAEYAVRFAGADTPLLRWRRAEVIRDYVETLTARAWVLMPGEVAELIDAVRLNPAVLRKWPRPRFDAHAEMAGLLVRLAMDVEDRTSRAWRWLDHRPDGGVTFLRRDGDRTFATLGARLVVYSRTVLPLDPAVRFRFDIPPPLDEVLGLAAVFDHDIVGEIDTPLGEITVLLSEAEPVRVWLASELLSSAAEGNSDWATEPPVPFDSGSPHYCWSQAAAKAYQQFAEQKAQ